MHFEHNTARQTPPPFYEAPAPPYYVPITASLGVPVAGLIFPGILLLLVALWGVFSSNRKFKKEFQRRGMTWTDANAAAASGEGVLVIDTVYGPPRGLGQPAIWYLSQADAGVADLGEVLQNTARIVYCPKPLRSYEALKKFLPVESLRGHGWDLDRHVTTSNSSK